MTSEVVVMNSLGVALASDSATTVGVGRRNKVHNSADKLFMLSHRHPVGVMVYNNASLLGIPWETLIKMFRIELGSTELGRLEHYGQKLVEFLNGNRHLFPEDVEYKFFIRMVETLYRGINKGIHGEILAVIRQGVEEPDQTEIANRYILESHMQWSREPSAEHLDAAAGNSLASRGSGDIHKLVERNFLHLGISAESATRLHELAVLAVSRRKILDETRSGLVIAGFGSQDFLPVVQTFDLGEIYGGRLKYQQFPIERIDRENNLSVVKPFAQSEMVETFLGGISPALQVRFIRELTALLTKFPDTIIDSIADLSRAKREKWKAIMQAHGEVAAKSFVRMLDEHRVNRHLAPVRLAITNLPKDQLAHVAASLVNLNSFQKRMSPEQETVGGPIDVALITKGDGFVWIERKHYFRPELNHHFFRNYAKNDVRVQDHEASEKESERAS